MITRERFNELQEARRFGEVAIQALEGEAVRLRRLTVAQLDAIDRDDPLSNAKTVAQSVVDAEGVAMFTPEEVHELELDLYNELVRAVKEFNGFPDEKAAEKN